MAPLPKRKLSTRRQGNREKALRIKMRKTTHCLNCAGLVLPHHVCSKCGFYNGKQVIVKKTKRTSKK